MLEILKARAKELELEVEKSVFTPEDEALIEEKVKEYRNQLIQEVKQEKSKSAELLNAKLAEVKKLIADVEEAELAKELEAEKAESDPEVEEEVSIRTF